MGWFKKKSDPISDRASALTSEIASLEAQIKRLDEKLHPGPGQPRLRSTALPRGLTISHSVNAPAASTPTVSPDPVFEEINPERLTPRAELETTAAHYNEMGLRKYDFPALLERLRHFFHGPSTSNPKLVSYLAAGGVQGLRPLRKEKRVARNRFIGFTLFLLVILLGLFYIFRSR
ncbi:MAG: hypothetical protein V9H26_29165 [Verrucomicrobiota bacterium]|nr:hypothetical protein [Verrucomicrobiota bacterium]MCC6821806.1 hypothetical protein [Limisphaerales bacterium]